MTKRRKSSNSETKLRCLAEAAMGLLVISEEPESKIWPDVFGGQSTLWMVRRCLNDRLITVSPYECNLSYVGPGYHLEITEAGRACLKRHVSDTRYVLCSRHRLTLKEAATILGVHRPRASQLLKNVRNISTTKQKEIFTRELFHAWDSSRWRTSDLARRGI